MDRKWKNKTASARYWFYELNSVETMQKLQDDKKTGDGSILDKENSVGKCIDLGKTRLMDKSSVLLKKGIINAILK